LYPGAPIEALTKDLTSLLELKVSSYCGGIGQFCLDIKD